MKEGTWEEIDKKNKCGRKLQRGDEKEVKIQGVLTLLEEAITGCNFVFLCFFFPVNMPCDQCSLCYCSLQLITKKEGVLTVGIGIDKNLRMPILLLISCID